MELAGLLVTVVATLIAAWSAWIARKQRKDAQDAAVEARADAVQAIKAAKRAAVAQESIAAGHDEDRRLAAESQAKKIRIHGSQQGNGRGRVKVTNASTEPIFDIHIHSITALIDGDESPVSWQPNPYTRPVLEVIDQIDGEFARELYPFFGEDWPGRQWSPIVRFRDANQVQWEINLDNEIARVEDI